MMMVKVMIQGHNQQCHNLLFQLLEIRSGVQWDAMKAGWIAAEDGLNG